MRRIRFGPAKQILLEPANRLEPLRENTLHRDDVAGLRVLRALVQAFGPRRVLLELHQDACEPIRLRILDEWGLPYKVAEYEPNAGRPISQKVADLMEECGAAILIFTADRELRTLEDEPVWLSSANVAHELGAASVLYSGKVVIFK